MKRLPMVDLFAGAGGTSTGAVEAAEALGYEVELTAINHWPVAVATHAVNHPKARHLCTGVDVVDPRSLYKDGELYGLWASPECTHHSVARGGKPINDQSRATAWCVPKWAEAARPVHIWVENVPEFVTWGGLTNEGRPLKSQRGKTFAAWVAAIESLGYRVDWRVLCAADYGDPTERKRLIVQAVRGKRRIVWPEPTHCEGSDTADLFGRRRWAPARECIDFSIPSQSIYGRKRPLSPKTLARIEAGLKKFGLKPFVAAWDHQSGTGVWSADQPLSTITTKARHGVVQPFLIELRGTAPGQIGSSARSLEEPMPTITAGGGHVAVVSPFLVQVAHGSSSKSEDGRTRGIDQPLPTVCGNGEWALCEPFLLPQQSGGVLRPLSEPAPTVATSGAIALIEPYLIQYYGTGTATKISDPMPTVTTKHRHGLVEPIVIEIGGSLYLLDILFRMLQPHELAAAQGFRKNYRFTGNKSQQVRQIGNAVPRRLARAVVAAALSQNSDVSWLVEKESEVAA